MTFYLTPRRLAANFPIPVRPVLLLEFLSTISGSTKISRRRKNNTPPMTENWNTNVSRFFELKLMETLRLLTLEVCLLLREIYSQRSEFLSVAPLGVSFECRSSL